MEKTNNKWFKLDLHHHSYRDYGSERKEGLKDYTKIIDYFYENNGSIIAITDHDRISFDSIREYEEYIKTKKEYERLQIWPGIELTFSIKDKNIDLILIFNKDDKKSLEKLQNLQNQKENVFEDQGYLSFGAKDIKNSSKFKRAGFSKTFDKIVDFLEKEKIEFFAFPHFLKGNVKDGKNFNKEKFEDIKEFYKKVIFFNFLESPSSRAKNPRYKKWISEITNFTGNKMGTFMGSDSHSFKDKKRNAFKNNLDNKVTWFYNINSFNDLNTLARFPETRIWVGENKKDRPYVVKNFIKNIKINDTQNNINKIKLLEGLNVVIGRRGSGKSELLKEIKKKLQEEKSKLIYNTEYYGNKKLISYYYLKQDDLAKHIHQTLKNFSKKNTTSSTIYFSDLNIETKEFEKNIDTIKIEKEKVVKYFYEVFQIFKENINDIIDDPTTLKKITIWNKILILLKKNNNKDIIDLLKKDIDEIEKMKGNLSLDTQLKIDKILFFLKKELQENKKYKKSWIHEFVIILENEMQSFETKQKTRKSNIASIKNKNLNFIFSSFMLIFENIKNIEYIFKNKLNQGYQNFFNKEKILQKNFQKMDNLEISFPIQLKKKCTFKMFLKEFISSIYLKSNKQMKIKEILHMEKRKKPNPINDIFDEKEKIFLNGVDISKKSKGQQQEMYIFDKMTKISKEKYDILIFDQPEDNLDSLTVQKQIIEKINEWGFTKQIIIATHDPKIIINCDSQNVILAEYNSKDFSDQDYTNVSEKDMKKEIYKIIDAKKRYPYIRFKEYGGWEND